MPALMVAVAAKDVEVDAERGEGEGSSVGLYEECEEGGSELRSGICEDEPGVSSQPKVLKVLDLR